MTDTDDADKAEAGADRARGSVSGVIRGAFGRLRRALPPALAAARKHALGRPGRTAGGVLAVVFFVFALGYPLLYVFEEVFRVPAPVRAVGPGQTLDAFAREHSASVEDIRAWNGLAPDASPAAGTTLRTGRDGIGFGRFTQLLSNPTNRGWIANSLALAFVVTLAAFAIALPLAFFTARREFPGKGILGALVLVPLVLPPFVGAIGMSRMLSRFGAVNLVLMHLGLIQTPLDFLGAGRFWGVVVLEALHLYPIMYLNLAAAMANVDPALEEAAASLGDSGVRRFMRVTFPLMLPGVFAGCAIVFVWAFTDLGTPLVFQYQEVAPKRIYDMTQSMEADPLGYALVVVVLAIASALFLVGRYLTRRRPVDSATKGVAVRAVVRAKPWERRLAYALFGAVTVVALLPHLGVVTQAFAGRWFMSVLPEEYTLAHVTGALTHELAASSIRMSLVLSLASTVVDVVLGVTLAVYIVRSRSRWVPLVDTAAMLPLAIPGLVLAFGYVGAYSGWGGWISPRVNPMLLLVVAYSVRRLPYVVRSCVAGLRQTPRALEEASASLGADPATTLRRVTLPLLAAHLIAGGILAFSFAMLEVSDSLILAMREQHYPITKAIYQLNGRLSDGPGIASALGLFGMVLLALSLWAAAALVGRRLGEMFRA